MTTPFKDLVKPLTSSKLGDVYVKGALRFKKIVCDNALVGAEMNLTDADFIFFDENSTATGATLSVDDESGPQLPIGPLRGMRDMPMKRVFITCAAQAGKVLNAWWGKGVYIYGAQPSGKGQWYDRNPADMSKSYNNGVIGPHANTMRWTYTVPANRKATIEAASIELFRSSAAAPVGQVEVFIQFNGVNYLIIRHQDNTVGARAELALGQGGIMLAGAVLEGHTLDLGTGGTFSYSLFAKIMEFDA